MARRIKSPLHRALAERDYNTAAHIAVYEAMATLSEKEPAPCPSRREAEAGSPAIPTH